MTFKEIAALPHRVFIHYKRILITKKLQRKYGAPQVTIISQNCIGGVIYHVLGMEFLSPTINMAIEGENFVKLCLNPRKYFEASPRPLFDKHIDEKGELIFSHIQIEDIVINAIHYETAQEACVAWARRSKRVNLSKIAVIANSWDLKRNAQFIRKIAELPYPTKIFTLESYGYQNELVQDPKIFHMSQNGTVLPLVISLDKHGNFYYERMFDFYRWLYEIDVGEIKDVFR